MTRSDRAGQAATVLAWLAGWLLVVGGLASVVGPCAWWLGGGVGLLAVGGLRPLLILVMDGAYFVWRSGRGGSDGLG